MNLKIIRRLSDIPANLVIAIYGAGAAGVNFLRILKAFRTDLTPLCFIDSFKTGEADGLKIRKADKFLQHVEPGMLVLIASINWRQMELFLRNNQFNNYMVIPPHFIVPSGFSRLSSEPETDPRDNSLSNELFSPDDRRKHKTQLDQVAELLTYPGDKTLFRVLTGTGEDQRNYADRVADFYYNSRLKRQYFDFIRYDDIYAIIEGGAADGNDTSAFLNAAGHGCRIYSFEPNIRDYHAGIYKPHLEINTHVTVLPKGLWHTNSRLYFKVSGLSSHILEHMPKHAREDEWESIDVVSIDQFVKEYNIEKVDFIKMDIEGAELNALKGAVETLKRDRPQLAICIYHSKEDFFQIPLYLNKVLHNYTWRIGHYTASSLETVWYGIPQEISG